MKEYRVLLKMPGAREIESAWVNSREELKKVIEIGIKLYRTNSYIVQSRDKYGEKKGEIEDEY